MKFILQLQGNNSVLVLNHSENVLIDMILYCICCNRQHNDWSFKIFIIM